MIRITNLRLPFDHHPEELRNQAALILGIKQTSIYKLIIQKRSLDARKGRPLTRVYSLLLEIKNQEIILAEHTSNPQVSLAPDYSYSPPELIHRDPEQRPIIVGTGPAGIFSALILAESGLRPILLERGKPVKERTQDTYTFWEKGILDTESNVQFGEGGAGTYSDGKLQTNLKDKNNRHQKILHELVLAGAPEEILYENKPHVGTANLISVLKNLRKKITDLGGEYRFNQRVDDLIIKNNSLLGVRLADGDELLSDFVVLAIGHSARDTYQMLFERGVNIEAKPFSVGFRIEHPQELINKNQYGVHNGHPSLGSADYQLVYRSVSGRTVYSFCMCPGGSVIAAASEIGGLVTNGMSQYARDGMNANSAIVAEVFPADFADHPLGGVEFQRFWENKAFQVGGENYFAPVQLVGDFCQDISSSAFGEVSPTYTPGTKFADLRMLCPDYVVKAILEALPIFDKKIVGFMNSDAVFTAVETRTSAPLRILRGKDHQSLSLEGLYPIGEGSGYAGGIMSSAVDGIKTAEIIIEKMNEK